MTGAILGPRSPINRSILNVCEDLEGVRGYKRALLYSFFLSRPKKTVKICLRDYFTVCFEALFSSDLRRVAVAI